MENFVLILFCVTLLGCVILDVSVLYALIIGLCIFIFYGLKKGFSFREMGDMCISGVRTTRNILITFVLIGMLTAFWRAAGTIPAIICYSADFVKPSIFLFMTFILNCVVSVLTGTSFGTAATMGVICSAMGNTMGIPMFFTGGAVVSGIFFGDRCSPVSTSALLVSELTNTNIFSNIKGMIKTSIIPFFISCLIYIVVGFTMNVDNVSMDLKGLFGQEFVINWICLIPAFLTLILSFFRWNVKTIMGLSILSAIFICVMVQNIPVGRIFNIAFFGYFTDNQELSSMVNGGGIMSMVKVGAIVCISSAYSGIFKKTGILDNMKGLIFMLSKKITVFGAMFVTGVVSCAVSCNQTLGIMLTHQLCKDIAVDDEKLAINLENTAVIVAPLIPWAVASAVPIATINAPISCLFFAVYLYILPLWNWMVEVFRNKVK